MKFVLGFLLVLPLIFAANSSSVFTQTAENNENEQQEKKQNISEKAQNVKKLLIELKTKTEKTNHLTPRKDLQKELQKTLIKKLQRAYQHSKQTKDAATKVYRINKLDREISNGVKFHSLKTSNFSITANKVLCNQLSTRGYSLTSIKSLAPSHTIQGIRSISMPSIRESFHDKHKLRLEKNSILGALNIMYEKLREAIIEIERQILIGHDIHRTYGLKASFHEVMHLYKSLSAFTNKVSGVIWKLYDTKFYSLTDEIIVEFRQQLLELRNEYENRIAKLIASIPKVLEKINNIIMELKNIEKTVTELSEGNGIASFLSIEERKKLYDSLLVKYRAVLEKENVNITDFKFIEKPPLFILKDNQPGIVKRDKLSIEKKEDILKLNVFSAVVNQLVFFSNFVKSSDLSAINQAYVLTQPLLKKEFDSVREVADILTISEQANCENAWRSELKEWNNFISFDANNHINLEPNFLYLADKTILAELVRRVEACRTSSLQSEIKVLFKNVKIYNKPVETYEQLFLAIFDKLPELLEKVIQEYQKRAATSQGNQEVDIGLISVIDTDLMYILYTNLEKFLKAFSNWFNNWFIPCSKLYDEEIPSIIIKPKYQLLSQSFSLLADKLLFLPEVKAELLSDSFEISEFIEREKQLLSNNICLIRLHSHLFKLISNLINAFKVDRRDAPEVEAIKRRFQSKFEKIFIELSLNKIQVKEKERESIYRKFLSSIKPGYLPTYDIASACRAIEVFKRGIETESDLSKFLKNVSKVVETYRGQ